MTALAYRLNKRVTIQAPPAGQNEFGEPSSAWTNLVTDGDGKVWAEIRDQTGRQYFAGQAAQNPVSTQITIRYRAGVLPAMRVLYEDAIYDIQSVLGQDRRLLTLMCTRGMNNG